MVKVVSSAILQSFRGFEYNPTDATFTLNTVLKLNGVMHKKWNRRIK